MILEPRKIKSDTVSTVSPSISHEVMGPDVGKSSQENKTGNMIEGVGGGCCK